MTTVASGFCTSAPVPVASAIGTKPSDATSAVMRTGRKRSSAPRSMASLSSAPSRRSWLMQLTITSPFSTATPERAMKPTRAVIENGMSRSHNARMPPVRPSGTPLKTRSANRTESERTVEQEEDEQEAHRNNDRESLARSDEVLELAAPVEPTARRQLDFLDGLLRRGHERAEITAAHVALNDDAALAVLAADLIHPSATSTSASELSGTNATSIDSGRIETKRDDIPT
jgi:hypothetical protein